MTGATRIVLVGAGGCGRDTLDVAEACRAAGEGIEIAGFLVDPEFAPEAGAVHGYPVLGGMEWLAAHAAEVLAVVAVGDPRARRTLAGRAAAAGARFATLVHPSVIRTERIRLGTGVVIAAGSILAGNVTLGDHAHVNLACTLTHDVFLGEFATLAPGVRLSGGVRIGAGASVGTGACFRERTSVGEWAVVGAGAVVIRDVPAGATAVGVPARVIRTGAVPPS